ncbi:MAG TPA: antibiotic biosynthesis monooxygenase [Dehalococcoidia bacterium]|jgi:heme-degrading monooxygenase HmoA
MFVAMNNFRVVNGKQEEFENIWKGRESHLQSVPGFVRFALLRGDAEGEYISHSTWESRDAFTAWTQSEAFIAGHRQGGSLMGVLEGPPAVRLYEAVIAQEFPAKATA